MVVNGSKLLIVSWLIVLCSCVFIIISLMLGISHLFYNNSNNINNKDFVSTSYQLRSVNTWYQYAHFDNPKLGRRLKKSTSLWLRNHEPHTCVNTLSFVVFRKLYEVQLLEPLFKSPNYEWKCSIVVWYCLKSFTGPLF